MPQFAVAADDTLEERLCPARGRRGRARAIPVLPPFGATCQPALPSSRRAAGVPADVPNLIPGIEGRSMKVYLGGPMFDLPNVEFNLRLAAELRAAGHEVYCPNENKSINDKSRADITAEAVYLQDLAELCDSNVFVCQVAEDSGTMWEAGLMDCLSTRVDPAKYYGVVGLATDIRLQTIPDPSKRGVDNQSWALNAFVVGGLQHSLGIVGSVSDLVRALARIRDEREGASSNG